MATKGGYKLLAKSSPRATGVLEGPGRTAGFVGERFEKRLVEKKRCPEDEKC